MILRGRCALGLSVRTLLPKSLCDELNISEVRQKNAPFKNNGSKS